ncbi:hypothetical protein B0T10DRAFT_511126 [Thelonectria olida]|uniref:Uncharacterized protein n=1 Tax=Thelonectria olida TaxID=1576542 RepID=A0A9P8W7L0_9HYPO|nr:hypothetical protein B0T10DRAFT_511126 [Thelonectria olida]
MTKPKSVAMAITANHPARSSGRQWAFTLPTVLLALALVGWLITTMSLILIIISGSRLINNDINSSGPMRLFLSRFAIVKFNGIVPGPDSESPFLVTFYLFLTSIGWEYPSAISKSQSAGFIEPTYPSIGLSLPTDFAQVGQRVGLDPSAWGCFAPSADARRCESPFYAAFRGQRPWNSAPGYFQLFLYTISIAMALRIFVVEFLIVYRPGALRCRCRFGRRICPCPRGEAHEIALLPQSFWDRYRLWAWLLGPFLVAISSVDVYYSGESLLAFFRIAALENNSGAIMKGVAPQMGSGFVALFWVLIIAPAISTLLILAKLRLSHSAPDWMQQEDMSVSKEEADAKAHSQQAAMLIEPLGRVMGRYNGLHADDDDTRSLVCKL